MQPEEARVVLGLGRDFDTEGLKRARRAAMLRAHPDHGGSFEELRRVEIAVDVLVRGSTVNGVDEARSMPPQNRDCPSFTISALPAEAFEWLLLAAAELGDVVDDDPPYRLEVQMIAPNAGWVVLDVVPDAGASTVTLAIEADGATTLERIRDVWIETLNGLSTP